jgi:hypothetical protein
MWAKDDMAYARELSLQYPACFNPDSLFFESNLVLAFHAAAPEFHHMEDGRCCQQR